jgi:hypothetical protein
LPEGGHGKCLRRGGLLRGLPPTGCETDDACNAGEICVEGECVTEPGPDCGPNTDSCPEGYVCHEGSCVEEQPPGPSCISTGCSGELCYHEPQESTCAEEAWYACLELTTCGAFGPEGSCGWEPTEAYMKCLEGFGVGPDECGPNKPCGDAFKCVEGVCVDKETPPECGPNKPCGDALKCVEGVCVDKETPPECGPNKPCGDALKCVEGVCVEKETPSECMVTGCSNELCYHEAMASVCIDEPWFVCLELTSCGSFGEGGACAWKMTDAYWLCLQDFEGGEGCTSDADCEAGFACECVTDGGDMDGDVACEWMCVAKPTEDIPDCVSDAQCEGDLECSTKYGDCLGNPECKPGGPCTDECWGFCAPPEAVECWSDADCADDEFCDFGWNAPNGVPIMAVGTCKLKNPCVITGCFDQLCAPNPVEEVCKDENWEPSYECLPLADCGLFSADGACGWHETEEFIWCVEGDG